MIMSESKKILITGASSGFGLLMAKTIARAKHTVYASMRGVNTKNAAVARELETFARENSLSIKSVELDILSDISINAAVAQIIAETGKIDVLINNAGMLTVGVSECFTPEQVMQCFETNVVGHFRVSRAVLPRMRERGDGLVIQIGSVTSRVVSPFQGPYVAAKAAWDNLAQTMHFENTRYGVDSVIVQPGAYTAGTNHFPNAVHPADREREKTYSLIADVPAQLAARLNDLIAPGVRRDLEEVAETVLQIIETPKGTRQFRVVIDPQHHGAAEINRVADEMQQQFMRRMKIEDLLAVRPPRRSRNFCRTANRECEKSNARFFCAAKTGTKTFERVKDDCDWICELC